METPIQFVKGVGPKLGALFQSRGISTVWDLFQFYPRTYEDRSEVSAVTDLKEGQKATLSVQVLSQRWIPIQRLGRSILEVKCCDSARNPLSLKWFHPPRGLDKKLIPGAQLMVTGKVKEYMGRFEILHPEMNWGVCADESEVSPQPHVGRVIPVYTELDGIPSRTFRKVLWEGLEKFGSFVPEDLPQYLLERRALSSASDAVRSLHFPPESQAYSLGHLAEFDTPGHHRLIYEEFFKFELLMIRQKLNVERSAAYSFGNRGGVEKVRELTLSLPFRLTRGQGEAVRDILEDLKQPHPMNRLVQGDVGSGKTAVALLTAACVVSEGDQVALMAPTEILAEQHLKNAQRLLKNQIPAALLTGKTTHSERDSILKRLKEGEPLLLIGTHALLEDPVVFKKLSYVLVDEQHRFGVEQRRVLREKGSRLDSQTGKIHHPHSLILTATPIPRTLAMTAFADLTVSTISELPPGRSPIHTQVVRDQSQRSRAYQKIREQLELGRQVYFIYPLVNESEAEGFTHLKSAVAEAERLAQDVFSGFRVGLLHGQMRADQKADVMDRFKKGELHILVSTTVVEVGVDVPNASVMVIEHSERFGLSQLHQLRGRVGRGEHQSYCFLFSAQRAGGVVPERLEVLEETCDGFKIAEADLEIRGPGEFLGTRQAGSLPFRLGNLVRDRELLIQARDDAMQVLREDSELLDPKHSSLKRYFSRDGILQSKRLNTF